MPGISVKYSEAFKLQVISELRSGELSCIGEARSKYGITGSTTIRDWLKKYGCRELLPKRVRIEMPEEQSEIKKLKKRIRELEKALAETKVDEVLNRAHFEILCEQMGLDIEETKKKIAEKLLKEGER
jgi:transposase-like protein